MATQDLKTHADLGEVTPAATDAIGLWRGSAGSMQLAWVQHGNLISAAGVKVLYESADNSAYQRALRGDRSGYELTTSGPTGTLTLSKMMIDVFGTPTGSITLTMPNGLVLNEKVDLVTSGTWGAHVITLNDTAAQTIKVLQSNVIYGLRWRGTGVTPPATRWSVEGPLPRHHPLPVELASVNGTLDHTHIGKRLTTTGPITIPTNIPGWWAEIVVGNVDHDWTFAGNTLDIGVAGWSAGDEVMVVVTGATTLRYKRTALADIGTELDF